MSDRRYQLPNRQEVAQWGTFTWPREEARPPVRREVSACLHSLRYLGEDERIYIADRLREHASYRVIAKELERSPSTISREIRRNSHPGVLANTVHMRRNGVLMHAGPARKSANWQPIPCCAWSCRTIWTRSGVRSRSCADCALPDLVDLQHVPVLPHHCHCTGEQTGVTGFANGGLVALEVHRFRLVGVAADGTIGTLL